MSSGYLQILESAASVNSVDSAVLSDAIDFDGTNDYLSRSSDLAGNADSKTFTFSAWVWSDLSEGCRLYSSGTSATADGQVQFWVSTTGIFYIQIAAANASTSKLRIDSPAGAIPKNTFTHILVSIDMNQIWTTAQLYVNDVLVPWQIVTSYVNEALNFTNPLHTISASPVYLSVDGKQRLAHVFLDYTYRDLSIEANRRLFITADRKPTPKATLAALNPILYLPMDDYIMVGKNYGTGGDFALNGVVAQSGRGPSQFNAPYSDLNGTSQYLSRTSALTGIADGKQFTFACCFQGDVFSASQTFLKMTGVGGSNTSLEFTLTTNYAYLSAYDSGGNQVLDLSLPLGQKVERNYHIVISVDLASTTKRYVYVNGELKGTGNWGIFINSPIRFSTSSNYSVGATISPSGYFNGRLGNVFFHTSYIDLSVPANLAKFVTGTGIDAKPVDMGANGELLLGVQPLIYLPMYGNNAGKNYGSGGDFTVNSGPYPGARGPSEFWGNKADFDGTTGYLYRTSALTGVGDGKTFSFSIHVNRDISTEEYFFYIADSDYNPVAVQLGFTNSGYVYLRAWSSAGTKILDAIASTTVISTGTNYSIQACVDLTATAKRFIYVNGAAETVAYSTYTNANIALSRLYSGIAALNSVTYNGRLAEFYFTTDYIDFSKEANRLKFRDAFGNPVDLTPQIQAGTIPNPAIYMRFDPANFGKNSGTGGDFTVSGTITDGGQL